MLDFLRYFMEHADSLLPDGFVAVADSIYRSNLDALEAAAGVSVSLGPRPSASDPVEEGGGPE